MDYEKKYKEMKARVLEMGRGYVKGLDYSKPRQIAEYIDPELKESEDEKIRKWLIEYFDKINDEIDIQDRGKILAWLKKQNSNVDNANKEYRRGYREGKQEILDKYAELEKQGEQKPAWSEEDENTIKVLMNIIRKSEMIDSIIYTDSLKEKLYDWLKSLKQRYTWKPSDEQITVLELASKYERVFTLKQIDILIGLKEQLKKLKGKEV